MQSLFHAESKSADAFQQAKQKGSQEAFVWTKHWYPLMLVTDLDAENPTPHTLLNIQMVIWQDGQGNWGAAEDRCPHRSVMQHQRQVLFSTLHTLGGYPSMALACICLDLPWQPCTHAMVPSRKRAEPSMKAAGKCNQQQSDCCKCQV